ncbi:MAG: HAD-IIA family hydrolase [Candidatus Lokiarchaeota archaeon]|nr:HAD-IIA family hydrolase [Candidatus Lokiarchaeota archaeon]
MTRELQELLNSKSAWILDLDGVVYRGKEAVPGAAEAVALVKRAGKRALFLTNNSTRTREAYVDVLRGMGIESATDDVFTSASLAAAWLVEHVKSSGSKPEDVIIYVIGEDGLKAELQRQGFSIAGEQDFDRGAAPHGKVGFVVVGLDRQLTYHKLHIALNCISRGAAFLATNDDPTLPVEGGTLAPGAGAIVQALVTCSKHPPDYGSPFGKPNPLAFHEIARATGIPTGSMVSIGDRPETDVLASNRAGVTSILVLTGVTREGDAIPDGIEPDVVLESISALDDVLST